MKQGNFLSSSKAYIVRTYTKGIIGPSVPMLGPLKSGDTFKVLTAPGCWGPMITPKFSGGHEVSQPIAVEGAELGDAIVLKIRCLTITSQASSSGVMRFVENRYRGDPFVDKFCPQCGTEHPESFLEGIGEKSVHCAKCGAEVSPFRFRHGYTMVLDHTHRLGLTVEDAKACEIAKNASFKAALPESSEQHPILVFAAHQMPGVLARIRPFIGNIGTIPSVDLPDSHNAGDFGSFLIDAPHRFSLTKEELLTHKTDGHMDNHEVRDGAVLICPVKVAGGGIYVGDLHAMQGNGEFAMHATDVAGEVEIEIGLIKGLNNDGPILFPNKEDLPFLAKPFDREEKKNGWRLAQHLGQKMFEECLPIQFIGSGLNLNEACDVVLARAAQVTGLPEDEIRNRATIAGSVDIARLPGVVKLTFLCPIKILEKIGLAKFAREQYGD